VKTERIDNLDLEIKVPGGVIGVVSEVAVTHTGVYQIMLVVFPDKPLPPAVKIPGVLRVTGRTLTQLRPGESCTVNISTAYTAGKRTITNEEGVAKVERAGTSLALFSGPMLGTGGHKTINLSNSADDDQAKCSVLLPAEHFLLGVWIWRWWPGGNHLLQFFAHIIGNSTAKRGIPECFLGISAKCSKTG